MPQNPEFAPIEAKLSAAASGMMRVYGVRRSGQHAVINWILRNCGQAETVFLNNRRIGQSPLRLGRLAARFPESTKRAQALAKRLAGRIARGQQPFLLISYEHGFSTASFQAGNISPGFDNNLFDHEVLITRSFVNWLPAFIRHRQQQNPALPAEGIDICQAVLNGVEQYKAHLQASVQGDHLSISFDNWVESPAYRLQNLNELGLDVLDNSLGPMQPFGGGSSFSAGQTPPEPRALTRRWKMLEGDDFAKQFLRLAQEDAHFMAVLLEIYPADGPRIEKLLA